MPEVFKNFNEDVTSHADGSEAALFYEFNNPKFNEATAYENYMGNWPMLYHLSPARKNIFNWIDFGAKEISILELGAGCGALTSYLTTLKNVSKIVAVEGSPVRAELIKIRCKNYKNVQVVSENIQDYQDNDKYDIVTLIGVLEYSGKYVNAPDPFLKIINHAASFLKPDGVLILAIENQLGHKYIAGRSEDHYGQAFEGLSNYPHYNGIRTFDKKTLQKMLDNAGLSSQQWFYPFPDYKMPSVILSDRSFTTKNFDWLCLLDLPTTDLNCGRKALFNEREFLKLLSQNSDVSRFMNSFLVFASKNSSYFVDENILASISGYFLTKKQFQNVKYFRFSDSGIKVMQKNFGTDSSTHAETPYYSGYQNLFYLIVDAWFQKQYDLLEKYLLQWFDTVKSYKKNVSGPVLLDKFEKFSEEHLGVSIYKNNSEWVPGAIVDLIIKNCLFNPKTNDIKVIDQEWEAGLDIPFKLVIDRGMYQLQAKMNQLTGCGLVLKNGQWSLPSAIAGLLPAEMIKPDIKSLFYFNYWFGNAVGYSDVSHKIPRKDFKLINRSIFLAAKRKTLFVQSAIFALKFLRKLRSVLKNILG